MGIRTRVLLAFAALTCAVALAAGIASATRIGLDSDTFRITWNPMTIATEGGAFTRCNLTLEGSFMSRTFSKVANSHVGWVTNAVMNTCEQPTTVFTETLPWRVRYDSFTGLLPNITGITFRILNFAIGTVGPCWYVSEENNPAKITYQIASSEVSLVSFIETVFIPKVFGSELCPPRVRFQGNGTPTVLGRTTRIRVRLVA